jgi:uncharacterized membrane protein YkvI
MDDELLIILIVICIFYFIDYLISKKFETIANMKGHKGYFWWCFWTTFVGYIMVVALPDRSQVSNNEQQESDELPDL